jgi:hypothetical protein
MPLIPSLGEAPKPGHFGPVVRLLDLGMVTTIEAVRSQGLDVQVFEVGQPLQAVLAQYRDGHVKGVREYFGPPIDDATTENSFISDGGVETTQSLTNGQDAASVYQYADQNHSAIAHSRPYDFAILWGNPLVLGGPPPYGVYWSDGKFDFSVNATADVPEDVLAMALSIYC